MTQYEWATFCLVWLASGLPLGPNALNCMVVSSSEGLSRSMWSVGGILLASLTHMALTSLGLSALLLASSHVFHVLKWLGVAYLLWMALNLLRKPAGAAFADGSQSFPKHSSATLVRQAFLISMTNPKAILLYLAIFPQFIQPGVPFGPQLALLVPTAVVITAMIYIGYCALGLTLRRLLSTAKRRLAFNRSTGGLFLACAAGLAAFDPRAN